MKKNNIQSRIRIDYSLRNPFTESAAKDFVSKNKKKFFPIIKQYFNSTAELKENLFKNGLVTEHEMRLLVQAYYETKKVTSDYLAVFDSTDNISPAPLDIIVVDSTLTSPIEVVSNFDLTFCQVWFDGDEVKAIHPLDILTKKGKLQKDYVDAFMQGNWFTIKRVDRYIERGFEIEIQGGNIKGRDARPLPDMLQWLFYKLYVHWIKYSNENLGKIIHTVIAEPFKIGKNPSYFEMFSFLKYYEKYPLRYREPFETILSLSTLAPEYVTAIYKYLGIFMRSEPRQLKPIVFAEPRQLEPSISILIRSHGGDSEILSDKILNETKGRVLIASIISSGMIAIRNRYNYVDLLTAYITTPFNEQASNYSIMEKYIEVCKKNRQWTPISRFLWNATHLDINAKVKGVDLSRQCYISRPIINRVFWFGGEREWTNEPFRGNIYVLRARFKNKTFASGELLGPDLNNTLQDLQNDVKSTVIDNRLDIKYSELLPMLTSRFQNVYIYEMSCRSRDILSNDDYVASRRRILTQIGDNESMILSKIDAVRSGFFTSEKEYSAAIFSLEQTKGMPRPSSP